MLRGRHVPWPCLFFRHRRRVRAPLFTGRDPSSKKLFHHNLVLAIGTGEGNEVCRGRVGHRDGRVSVGRVPVRGKLQRGGERPASGAFRGRARHCCGVQAAGQAAAGAAAAGPQRGVVLVGHHPSRRAAAECHRRSHLHLEAVRPTRGGMRDAGRGGMVGARPVGDGRDRLPLRQGRVHVDHQAAGEAPGGEHRHVPDVRRRANAGDGTDLRGLVPQPPGDAAGGVHRVPHGERARHVQRGAAARGAGVGGAAA